VERGFYVASYQCQSSEGKGTQSGLLTQPVAWPHAFFIHHWTLDGSGVDPFMPMPEINILITATKIVHIFCLTGAGFCRPNTLHVSQLPANSIEGVCIYYIHQVNGLKLADILFYLCFRPSVRPSVHTYLDANISKTV